MSATLLVRHTADDYTAWRTVYDGVDSLRAQHGCSAHRVLRLPDDADDVLVIHDFPTLRQAQDFASDPVLEAAMTRAGVNAPPRVEIFNGA